MTKKAKIYYSHSVKRKCFFFFVTIAFFFTFSGTHLLAQIADDEYQRAKEISDDALQQENEADRKKPQKSKKSKIISKGKSIQINKEKLEKLMTVLIKKMRRSFYKKLKCKEKYYSKNTNAKKSCMDFPSRMLMTSLNIYSEKVAISDMKIFNKKLTNLNVPKYKFEIKRSKNAFKIRQISNKKNIRIVRGPIDNVELTKFVLKEGFEHYAEFYLYISPRRAVLEIYVFDGKTHRLKWTDWQSVVYNPIYLNFTTGVYVSFIKKPTFTMLHTATGFYIPDFGNLAIYFDLGFSSSRSGVASEDSGSGSYDNISIGIAVGGLLSLNMVEMITRKKYASDFVITVGPGMFFDIPLSNKVVGPTPEPSIQPVTDAEGNITLQEVQGEPEILMNTAVKSNFIVPVGIKIPIENFSISFSFDPMRMAANLGFNYEF